MSNDLIAMFQNSAAMRMGVDDDTRAVAGNSGNKRISIEGGVFRKYAGGKEIARLEERSMNIVFVRMAHKPSRTFFKDTYKKGVKVSPTCWSQDAEVPDPACKTPQARSCRECPFSVKNSGNGGIGSACRASWRTAVVLAGDPSGDVMQLIIPSASVWGPDGVGVWRYRPYTQYLVNHGVSAGFVVTKMQFDTESSSPRLWFSPLAPVPDDMIAILQRQRETEAALRAVRMNVFQTDEGDATPEVAQPEPALAPVPEPVVREAPKTEAPAAQADVSSLVKKWSTKK
jgi:hypothetical protein